MPIIFLLFGMVVGSVEVEGIMIYLYLNSYCYQVQILKQEIQQLHLIYFQLEISEITIC